MELLPLGHSVRRLERRRTTTRLTPVRPIMYLNAFAPLALIMKLLEGPPVLVFFSSALAVIPAAALMSNATEHLSARSGPGVAGLLNVTFGNAPELIIAFFALLDGLQEVVKASLVGSIIGNCLLVLGAAMVSGGWNRTRQRFDRTAAQNHSGLLLVTVTALILPAVLVVVSGERAPDRRSGAARVRGTDPAPIDRDQPRDDRRLRRRAVLLAADTPRSVRALPRRAARRERTVGRSLDPDARRRRRARRRDERAARRVDRARVDVRSASRNSSSGRSSSQSSATRPSTT